MIQSLLKPTPPSSHPSKFVLLIACATLLLAVVACSEQEASEDDSNSDVGASGPTATTETAAETPDSPSPSLSPTTEEPVMTEATDLPTPTPVPQSTEVADVATPAPAATPTPEPIQVPEAAYLENMTHVYQTMNNCSAASTSMLLSHFGIYVDQETLRPVMRPNPDAKHGKIERIIGHLNSQGLRAMEMHGGSVETLQAFLANDIPVIVQQWLEPSNDPIGHYRVVRGYDDQQGIFRINDSMYGGDIPYTYEEFNNLWRPFSYRYVPVYRPDQEELVARILGDELDPTVNRQRTIERIQTELQARPDDAGLWFSLGSNYYDLGQYQQAVDAYERAVEIELPPKMIWYQIWPPSAYNEIGAHERALDLATQNLQTAGTFGMMHYERGRAYEAMGQIEQAIAEYRGALDDDADLAKAKDALQRLGAQ